MARVDANVILRYLTNEPFEQAEKVARLLARVAAGQLTLTIDEIVVAEVVWTLSSYYRMSHSEVVQGLLPILAEDGIVSADKSALLGALALFDEKNIDFADALLCAHMLQEGDVEIYSFDRHFDRVEGITRLEPS